MMAKAGFAAAVLASVLLASPASAQVGVFRFQDPTLLVGPGASIGVRVRELSSDELAKTNLQSGGVYIEDVEADTPAERAGLKAGDVVVEFDGERVRSVRTLARLVSETPPQRTVKTTVVRDGQRRTLDITPEPATDRLTRNFSGRLRNLPELRVLPRAPRALPQIPRFELLPPQRRLGVTLGAVDGQLADYFGVSAGVLVSAVDRDSAAARAGLKAGDVITAVNGRSVRRPSDVTDAVRDASAGSTVQLKVVRDKQEITVDVALPTASGAPREGAPVGDAGRIHV